MYRDAGADPRIEALAKVIAGEAEAREELTRIRFEQDGLVREVDELETQLARRGLLKSIFAKRDRGNVEENLRLLTIRRDMSVAREHQLVAQIEDAARARAELAQMERDTATRLRTSEGPLGTELRAVATSIETIGGTIDSMQRVLDAIDEALAAVRVLTDMLVLQALQHQAIHYAQQRLQIFAVAADEFHGRPLAASVHVESAQTRAVAQLAHTVYRAVPEELIRDAHAWIAHLDTAMSELTMERGRLAVRRDELRAHEAELIRAVVDPRRDQER